MLDKYLIEHCSPTLASLKTANLFSMNIGAETDFQAQIDRLNDGLKSKGIVLMVLKKEGNRALVYVCRKSYLQEDLNRPGVASFMKKYGYEHRCRQSNRDIGKTPQKY